MWRRLKQYRNLADSGRYQGVAAAVSLSLPVEGATFQGGEGGRGGLRLEQAIRRGRAGGRTPGEPRASLPGRLTRAPARRHCLYTVRSWPEARSPPAYASLFSKSEAPQPRQQREPESLLAASPAVRAPKSESREPREPSLRPQRLDQDPPAAPTELQWLSSASTSAHPSAEEAGGGGQGGRHPFSRGHHSYSPFRKNLSKRCGKKTSS